jgi:hypothetical protein
MGSAVNTGTYPWKQFNFLRMAAYRLSALLGMDRRLFFAFPIRIVHLAYCMAWAWKPMLHKWES